MEKEFTEEYLYKKYIEPTKKRRDKFIGVEIEIPIVNLDKKAVDFEIVHSVTEVFTEHFKFQAVGKDRDGNVFSALNPENDDIFSYDCSYNNLELSFGKELNLYEIQKRFNSYYSFLKDEFEKYNYTLTGMGVNPYRRLNRNIPIPSERYQMLFHHLGSYKKYNLPMYFHSYPEFGTFSSASQVQLDVSYDDLPLVLNTFSKLEPIKAVLFSNSVLLDEHEDLLCCRDMFWENSTHGINPHNIGMYECEFSNIDDILAYIETTSIYCVERDNKYVNFHPINIIEYFEKDSVEGEYYENGEYKNITVKPEPNDLKYLRTFKFEDLTFRGTIEFRSVCCQPIKDSMTVAAFHIGLMDNVKKLNQLLENDRVLYHNGYTAGELRKLLVKADLPAFINEDKLYGLIKAVLDISYDGLKKRCFGEEKLLKSLYRRVEEKTNPAKTMLHMKNHNIDMNDIILKYGKL